MKALSIRQPWAGLIAAGIKHIENRTWYTAYRGPLAIHASAKPDPDAQLARITHLAGVTIDDVWRLAAPRSCVIAVAELDDIRHCADRPGPCDCGPWAIRGQQHWHLANVRPLATPIGARGALGLWDFPQDVRTGGEPA